MRLFAAIVPPRAVLAEVRAVVDSVRPPTAAPPPPPKRGLLSRFGGRTPEAPQVVSAELTVPDVELMYLPITGFGNVTLGDSVQLIKALHVEAATWERPTVHLAGGTALEFTGDDSVWAKVDGDVERLQTIGRGVPQIVQRLGFFVDRRQFRPLLSVGTITADTTAPYLESLVAALDTFSGTSWTIESISLMKGLPEAGVDAFEEMEQMPLAGG